MKTRSFIACFALAWLAASPAQASSSALAVPGSQFSGYGTPVLVTTVGAPIAFANADPLAPHDLVAFDAKGADDRSWCVLYAEGQCPLFWAPLIPFGEVTPVLGLDALTPGTTYVFYCSIHPLAMKGTLIVLPT